MNETVRKPKGLMYLGIVCALLTSAGCLKLLLFPLPGDEVDTPGKILAVAAFFGLFAIVLPGLLIADYLRSSLTWRGDEIIVRNSFREQRIDLNRVMHVHWHPYHAGGIIVTVDHRKLGFLFSTFRPPVEFRLALIRRLRETIPVDRQTGWDRFVATCVLRLLRTSENQQMLPASTVRSPGTRRPSVESRRSQAKALAMALLISQTILFVLLGLMWVSRAYVRPHYGAVLAWCVWGVPGLLCLAFVIWKTIKIQHQRDLESNPEALAEWEAYVRRTRAESASSGSHAESSPPAP